MNVNMQYVRRSRRDLGGFFKLGARAYLRLGIVMGLS